MYLEKYGHHDSIAVMISIHAQTRLLQLAIKKKKYLNMRSLFKSSRLSAVTDPFS